MSLIKGKDDLSPYKGHAAEAFGAEALTHLQAQFITSQPEPEQGNAVSALAAFYEAAEKLRDRETEFNTRARKPGGPDLKANLRNSDQFAAIRTFHEAKENLLGMSGTAGKHIVHIVEQSIATTAQKSKPTYNS